MRRYEIESEQRKDGSLSSPDTNGCPLDTGLVRIDEKAIHADVHSECISIYCGFY